MGERRHARSRSGYRRSRRFRSDRRGVVAVIGTLLALLVFFALFGIFLTQYVPLWMEENESQLSNQLQASLATLKSGVDDQYILGGIPTYSVPFTLSSQTVPLLAQPTVATLSYLDGCPGGFYANGTPHQIAGCDFERLSYTTGAGPHGSVSVPYYQNVPTHYLELTVPDRYFPQMAFFFEGDGVAVAQSSVHQGLLVPPPYNLSRVGSSVTVTSNILDLLGSASTFSGQGSKDVTSTLVGISNVSSTARFLTAATGGTARPFNVTMTFGVHAVCGWYDYLYNTTRTVLGAPAGSLGSNPGPGNWTLTGASSSGALSLPASASVCETSLMSTYDLTLTIYSVSYAAAAIAQAQISFNAGGL
jgi:hypothetical protein